LGQPKILFTMKKYDVLVYIAGALRDTVPGYIQNLHRMITWGEKVRRAGFYIVIPGLDILQGLIMGDMEFPDYFENSWGVIKRCDAVFVTPKYEKSKGTKKEILYAKSLGIPVFFTIEQIVAYFNRPKK